MPRPRTPVHKAKLTGADKVHPERFRDRREPPREQKPVGAAPSYLNKYAKRAWATFVKEIPWLCADDRAALENVSLLRGRIMAGDTEELPMSFFTAYRQALSSLGATPVDKTKVYQPPEADDDDEFGQFVQ